MRKFISCVVAAALVTTILVMPATVQAETVSFTYFETPAMPDNLMTNPQAGDVFGNATDTAVVAKMYNQSSGWNGPYNAYKGYFVEAAKDTQGGAAFYSNLAGVVTTNGAGGLAGKNIEKDKAYVVSFLARNAGTTNSVKLNVGFGNTSSWADYVNTVENGSGGFTVADKNEWTEITGTLVAPSNNPYLTIGFPAGEKQGSKIELNLSYLPDDAIYFAEEVAYEFLVEEKSGKVQVEAGDELSFSAKMLNQVGTEGTLPQEFTWYVLNEEKTETASGFDITPSTDSKTANITVDSEIEPGTYAVVALNKNDVAKSYEITVEGEPGGNEPGENEPEEEEPDDGETDFTDWIAPSKPVNMMTNPTGGEVFGNENKQTLVKKSFNSDSGWNAEYNTYNGYNIEAINDVTTTDASYAKVAGITTTEKAGGLIGKTMEAGKAYVLSFLARNIGSTDSFKINFGLTSQKNWQVSYPAENGTEGYTISEKNDWTKIAGTVVSDGSAPFVSIGFMEGTKKGSKMEFNLAYLPDDAIYFAEEVVYEILLDEENDTTLCEAGDVLTFSAELLNQIGTKGTLSQEFKWYAVNEDRTEKVSGFSFSKEKSGVMTVTDSVEAGKYYIIAQSKEDSKIKKGWEITVQKPYQADYTPAENGNPGEVHDIEVTVDGECKTEYTFLDSIKLSVAIVDIDDNELSNAAGYEWKAYKENRRDEEENIVISASGADATVTFTPSIENGKYYIIAKATPSRMRSASAMQRSYEIVVNNAGALVQIANEINGATKENIESKLDTYIDHVAVSSDLYSKVDKKTLAGVLELTDFTAEDIKKQMTAACVVSLYANNPQNVTLNDAEGNFEYRDELGLSSLETNGVTLMTLFDNNLDKDAKNAVVSAASAAGIVSTKAFTEKIGETIILEGIKKQPAGVLGSGYVLDYITEANLLAAGIEKGKMTDSNVGYYQDLIAGKSLTKQGLEEILAKEPEEGGSEGGSQGGSQGGGSTMSGGSFGGGMNYAPIGGSSVEFTPFSDVGADHWAYKQIIFLKKQNIISGKSGNAFYPNDYLKREELAKIIVSAFELADSSNAIAFKDVANGAWYEEYIKIASSSGIIKGVSDEYFGIGEYVTRQDLCVMIARALGKADVTGYDLTFADKDGVSSYAVNSVSYLNMLSIVNGYEDNTFRPRALCTRAQAAKIIGDVLNYGIGEVK